MHFDNLLFILLGLAFVVLRWLAQRGTTSNKEPPQEPERPTRAPSESDEERVRRFMEALGNPVGSKPPPKVKARVEAGRAAAAEVKRAEFERQLKAPRRTVLTRPLPPLTTTPSAASAPKRVTLPQLIKTLPVEQKTSQRPAVGYAAAAQRQPAARPLPTDLQWLLSSPDGLRNAVILREVLGPPRAFQPFERIYV